MDASDGVRSAVGKGPGEGVSYAVWTTEGCIGWSPADSDEDAIRDVLVRRSGMRVWELAIERGCTVSDLIASCLAVRVSRGEYLKWKQGSPSPGLLRVVRMYILGRSTALVLAGSDDGPDVWGYVRPAVRWRYIADGVRQGIL